MSTRTLAVIALLFAGACAGTPNGTVRVDLDEFKVTAKPSSIDAGPVRFEQRNTGAVDHELVVIRTGLSPEDLPLDGVEVDLKAKGLELAARDEKIAKGSTRTLRTTLTAGDYVLICNVPGHYQSGMRTRFVAR